MDFRTEYKAIKSEWDIRHDHSLLSIGSCFADCMGSKLLQAQFDVSTNPLGIVYNPISSLLELKASLQGEGVDENDIIKNNSVFYSYQLHSKICATDSKGLEESIQKTRKEVADRLAKADYLLLTLGTAFVYELKSSGKTVANCHKMPSHLFDKRLLGVDEVIRAFEDFLEVLGVQNEKIKVILSVSPVRHTKDTLSLNNVSKSILRLACHYLTEKYKDSVRYFPAFEILSDDLRDYRFYKEDLIHPTAQAERYVWNKFSETYFTPHTIEINNEIADIIAALQHRVMNVQSSDYQNYLKNLGEKIENLNVKVSVPRLITELALKLKG